MSKHDTDNISKLCNRLADKHDLNVTVVRDLVEDLRVFFGEDLHGIDLDDFFKEPVLRIESETERFHAFRLYEWRNGKPVKPHTKRGAK